jgi:flagellar hook-basal body protein
MSLFGALSSGVSGLSAQSSALGAIADNVTNVNTIGYKGTDVQFKTLVTKQVSSTKYSPGGVQSAPKKAVDAQGLLQATTSATDLAISGQGFYVVNEQAEANNGSLFAYTRAGSFGVDKDGFLQNTAGWFLQGWPLLSAGQNTTGFTTVEVGSDTFIKAYKDSNGDTISINDNIVSSDDLRPINLNTIGGTASETKNIRLGANLPAGDEVGDQHKTNVVVFDTLGNSSNLELVWEKDRENAWGASLETPSGAATLEIHGTDNTDASPDVFAASGLLEFTGVPSDGESIIITDGTGNAITFEFDTDSSVVETSTLRQVDISASTITAATDVTPLLKAAIDASNLQGSGRFSDNGTDMTITQSTMGASIGMDVSNILTVNQIAANGSLGTFTVPAIDFAYKHGARIDFEAPQITPSATMDITFSAGTTITASLGTPFAGWQVGDSITLDSGTTPSDTSTANNDGTFTIVAVTDTVITLSSGDLTSATTETSGSTLTIWNNSTPTEVYNNLDTVITPASTGVAKTFRLHEPAQADATVPFAVTLTTASDTFNGAGNAFTISGLNTITATTAGTFTTVPADPYVVGDTITLSSMTTGANDVTATITGVTGTVLTFAAGTFNTNEAAPAGGTLTLVRERIAAAATFGDYTVGDSVTVSGAENTANNVTMTVVGAAAGYIEFAAGATTSLSTANTDDEAMKVTITTDSTGNVDFVDISAATSVADIVTQLAADINANTGIPSGSRFSGAGTSLIFEQSVIGDAIDIVMDSSTGDNSTGIITGEWVDSSTLASNTASDGETMAMIETSFGAKKAAVSFNGDGTPSEFNVDNIDIQWANGASDQEFTSTADDTRVGLFLGNTNIADGMTQFAGSYQINFISQNGAQFGNFAGISVGEDGVVTALFDNGVTRPVFMVPVATFVNPNRMDSLTGNVFIETDFSGQATVREAGEGGAGSIAGAALESSTVDLGEEFTAMIVTQQAYSAAAKIITTADEMLDELLRIK